MKYLFQIGIICTISFAGELLHIFLPLPVPASVYGIIILFVLLSTKIIKLKQVEETANYFLAILPILFLAPSVGLIDTLPGIAGNLPAFIAMNVISTIGVTIVTGLVAQAIVRKMRKPDNGEDKNLEIDEVMEVSSYE